MRSEPLLQAAMPVSSPDVTPGRPSTPILQEEAERERGEHCPPNTPNENEDCSLGPSVSSACTLPIGRSAHHPAPLLKSQVHVQGCRWVAGRTGNMTGHNWLDSQSFRLLVVPCRPPGPRAHLTLIQYFNLQPISNFINCLNIFQPKFTDCIWLSHFFAFL